MVIAVVKTQGVLPRHRTSIVGIEAEPSLVVSNTAEAEMSKSTVTCCFSLDPISALELNEPEVFKSKRILIVDDLNFALERARKIIEKKFTNENGCVIEAISDPEQAIKMISDAKAAGKSYDVLVTDLYMQRALETGFSGMNGDELLRRLSERDLFLPTVVFSGSWASDINQNLFSELDKARSREEIYSIVNRTSNSLNGIPLVQVDKTDGDVEKSLIYSMCGVLLMGKRAENTAIHDFLVHYKPKTLEDSMSREIISKALETYRVYKEFLLEVKKQFEENKLEKTYPCVLIDQFLNHDKEWHLNNIGDASSDRARVFFHDVVPVMQWIYEHSSCENLLSQDTLDKLEEFYRAINFYAISTKEGGGRGFKLHSFMQNLLTNTPHKVEIQNLAPDIRLPHSYYKVREIIMQPITNATKAIRGKSDGEIKMTVSEVSKNELTASLSGEKFIEIVIEDNGCGMPPEKVIEINERKCKEGNSTFGTLGWGLTILQDFISQVDGVYHVESELGKGTKFKIYLKAA